MKGCKPQRLDLQSDRKPFCCSGRGHWHRQPAFHVNVPEAGSCFGFKLEQMIELLDAGLEVETLLELIACGSAAVRGVSIELGDVVLRAVISAALHGT